MPYNPEYHHRRSIRLFGYDYGQEGLYFVTICAAQQAHLFGKVINDSVQLSAIGEIVVEEWERTPTIRAEVQIDTFVVMPNHIHCILAIVQNQQLPPADSTSSALRSPSRTLGSAIRGFKASVTQRVGYGIWKRNYYETIIRDQRHLDNVRQYIIENPRRWASKQ